MNKSRAISRGAHEFVYRTFRGDDLVQNTIFQPATVAAGLARLAAIPGIGELAYSPELSHQFEVILERRFADDVGPKSGYDVVNYGVLEDPETAAFYGVDVSQHTAAKRLETTPEVVERLLQDAVEETATYAAGLAQIEAKFKRGARRRLVRASDDKYEMRDPDEELFDNAGGGWSAFDGPISTADKTNTIQLYGGANEPSPGGYADQDVYVGGFHPAWLVDRAF